MPYLAKKSPSTLINVNTLRRDRFAYLFVGSNKERDRYPEDIRDRVIVFNPIQQVHKK